MDNKNTKPERLPRPNPGLGGRARKTFVQTGSRTLVTNFPSLAGIIEKRYGNVEEKVKVFYKEKTNEQIERITNSNITNIEKVSALVDVQNNLLRKIIDELKDLGGSSSPNIDLSRGRDAGTKPSKTARRRDQVRNRLQRRAAFRQIGARAGRTVRQARRVGRETASRLSSVADRIRQGGVALRDRFVNPNQRQTRPVPQIPQIPEVPRVTAPQVPEVPRIPPVPQVPEVPRVPPVPQVPEVPRVPVPETPTITETTRVQNISPPSVTSRVGSAARTILNVADRILAPTIFLDIETALRDMGDRAEYLPANRLLTFRRTLISAQQNVEIYNQLLRTLETEQDHIKRAEIEKDIKEQHAIIVGQRDRLIQMAVQLDEQAQIQYQRRIQRSQDGRLTISEHIVRLAPITRYILGDERDTSLEAVRKPSDFRALLERALQGAPEVSQTPATSAESETPQAIPVEPETQTPATPVEPTSVSDFIAASYDADQTVNDNYDANPADDVNDSTISSVLPYPENIIDLLSKTEFNELKIEAEKITFDGNIGTSNQNDAIAASYTPPPSIASNIVPTGDSTSPPVSTTPQSTPTQQQNTPETVPVEASPATPGMAESPASEDAAPASDSTPTESQTENTPVESENTVPENTTPTPESTPAGTPTDATPQTADTPSAPTDQQTQEAQQVSSNLTFGPGVDRRINPELAQKVGSLQSAFGKNFTVTSGYRDPQRNARVGGARNSAHTRKNAVDIQFSGNEQETIRLVQLASQAGFGGIGVYRPGFVHIDTESKRVWGPDYTSRTIPQWAKELLQAHMESRTPRTGPALSQEGTAMAAADQAQMRQGTQVILAQGQMGSEQNQAPTVPSSTHGGEVPLNKRFQNQVAA